jgi:hypothetical protein
MAPEDSRGSFTQTADTVSESDPDAQDRGERRRDRGRKVNPDIPPDVRRGLRPTVAGDVAPEHPVYPVSRVTTRMAVGFVAGLAAAAVVVAVTYLLMVTRVLTAPSFYYTSQAWFGDRGAGMTHVLGAVTTVVGGALWGLLFGLIVRRPTPAKGILFGLLPALVTFLIAPMGSRPLIAALVLNVFVYGFTLGRLSSWWLRPPSTSDTTPG